MGIGIGLAIAWGSSPVQPLNASPSDLRKIHKEDYVRMISAAYALDGDLASAKQRLQKLGLILTAQTFSDLIAEGKKSENNSSQEALTSLAQALGFKIESVSEARRESADSAEALVTQVVPAFRLVQRTPLTCADEPEAAHLRVFVRDAKGRELPNIAIEIRWANGEDSIITGLKPERGLGYADFEATPGTFTLTIANAQSDIASNLVIGDVPANCKNDRGATPRGWRLVFQQK